MKFKRIEKLVEHYLNEKYPSPEPTLNAKNPFEWLIAVMLSAHCTDQAVNSVTCELFDMIKSPSDIFKFNKKQIENVISRCGMFRKKSAAIIEICKLLDSKFCGVVPSDIESLMSLPLVGRKTALVVQSIAFGIPTFPVDTHIFRCSKRWGLSIGKNVLEVEKDLCLLFNKEKWNKLHLQIIHYGRNYCNASHNRNCEMCYQIKAFNASLIRS